MLVDTASLVYERYSVSESEKDERMYVPQIFFENTDYHWHVVTSAISYHKPSRNKLLQLNHSIMVAVLTIFQLFVCFQWDGTAIFLVIYLDKIEYHNMQHNKKLQSKRSICSD